MTVPSANIDWLIDHLHLSPIEQMRNSATWEFETFRRAIEFMYELLIVLEHNGFQYKWPLNRRDASVAYRLDNFYLYVSIVDGHKVTVQVG